MKVGRNDPCPCGSGQKYKKCCGKNNNVINFNEAQFNKDKELLIEAFFTYLFENYQEQIITDYLETAASPPEDPGDLVEDDDFLLIAQGFGFHKRVKNGLTPNQIFLEKNTGNFKAATLDSFKNYTTMYYSLYSVQEILPDNRYRLKDLLLEKEQIILWEESDDSLEKDDVLFCQLSNLGEEKELFFDFIILDTPSQDIIDAILNLYKEGEDKDLETFLISNSYQVAQTVIRKFNEEFFENE